LEYWDSERKRFPQYEHYGVLIAEDVTTRFLNVIGLFNGVIPLIAVQMKCVDLGEDRVGLLFTTVLDYSPATPDDDEPEEPKDRNYWEQKASKATLALADQLLALAQDFDAGYQLKFNKHYIGIAKDGRTNNFISFTRRKRAIELHLKLKRAPEIDQLLDDNGLDTLEYNTRGHYYTLKLDASDMTKHREVLRNLVERSYRNRIGE